MLIFNKLWLYIFTVCLKSAKRFIRIYTNGWLYIFTVCLKSAKRLIIIYLLAWYLFLELKIVKNGYYGNGVLFFAWDLGVIFFRHTDFLRFKISKNIFFLNLDFMCHRKMYRLRPCIPILGVFLLKVQKGCVYVIILFLVLVLFKIYVFIWKKGISKLLHQIAQKHTAPPSPSFSWGKTDFWEKYCPAWSGNDESLSENFVWGHENKWTDSIFWLTNVFYSNPWI